MLDAFQITWNSNKNFSSFLINFQSLLFHSFSLSITFQFFASTFIHFFSFRFEILNFLGKFSRNSCSNSDGFRLFSLIFFQNFLFHFCQIQLFSMFCYILVCNERFNFIIINWQENNLLQFTPFNSDFIMFNVQLYFFHIHFHSSLFKYYHSLCFIFWSFSLP